MSSTMKALRKVEPGVGLVMCDVPIPKIRANEVLVKVHKRAICGTDLHIWSWDAWSEGRLRLPVTTGHEFYGEIVEIGADVSHYRVGELVTAEMHVVCNQCSLCRTGQAHLCDNVVILGVDGDGIFAEYTAIPEFNLWRVPKGIDPEWAAIYDPFGNAVHTVMAGETIGKSVIVLGGGPIGLMAIAVAKAAGASQVFLSEVSPYRRNLGKKMGADRVINPSEEDFEAVVREETKGQGVDVVLEMSGHPAAIAQGFRVIKKGGRYTLLGIPSKPVTLDFARDLIFPGITLQGINGRRMFETWYQMDAFLVSKRVDLSPMITHRFPMSEFKRAFETGLSGQSGKIILT